jgi:hypothetical protein
MMSLMTNLQNEFSAQKHLLNSIQKYHLASGDHGNCSDSCHEEIPCWNDDRPPKLILGPKVSTQLLSKHTINCER